MFFFLFLACKCLFFFFFFSSRRRHTRSLCDWSSDVCSSDLLELGHCLADRLLREPGPLGQLGEPGSVVEVDEAEDAAVPLAHVLEPLLPEACEQLLDRGGLDLHQERRQRASCGQRLYGHLVRSLDKVT